METKLAENIRSLRKKNGLTQEQLAEALGVTVGAVHKWETKLSTPELGLITDMADFFGVSVDALLGYEMKDHRVTAVTERLIRYANSEDPLGLEEAEKAIRRFPQSFEVVYACAVMFMLFGGKSHDPGMLDRAYRLLEKALILLPQNTDPRIGEIGIRECMANVQIMLGRGDRAAELLKKHNREGIYNHQIGMTLSMICRRPEEAQAFLSEAFLSTFSEMLTTVMAKAYAFSLQGDQALAQSLLEWGLNQVEGLKEPEMTGYPDRLGSYLYVMLAYVCLKQARPEDAKEAMLRARQLGERFDVSPNYDARSLRFITGREAYYMHDLMGVTVADSIAYLVRLIGDGSLTALWEETDEHE